MNPKKAHLFFALALFALSLPASTAQVAESDYEYFVIGSGAQPNFNNYRNSTPVEAGIRYLAANNVAISGTSARLAILGEFSFSAREDTNLSSQALADPFDKRVTLDRDFLSLEKMK